MGRGSSGKATPSQKPAYISESPKAVKLRISVEDHILERTLSREVWVPKSQLSDDGRPGEWITDQKAQELYSTRRAKSEYTATWKDANGKEFSSGQTAKEKNNAQAKQAAFDAGKASYNALVAYAKAQGIKGVYVGLKRSTIEKKIKAAGK